MAISVDFPNKLITVPQADCTLVSGTLYKLPTDTVFRSQVIALASGEVGIPFDYPIDYNPNYTVFGVTYAPKIEVINGYQVQFTPDAQWSVIMEESNNNIADVGAGVLVQNQVQVIPNNSAGLIRGDISDQVVEGSRTVKGALRLILAAVAGKLSGADTTTVTIRDADDIKNRIVATVDADGNRTAITLDDS